MSIAWLVAALVLVLAEVLSNAVFAIFLAVGALGAAAAAALGADAAIQVGALAVLSALGILVARPPLLHRLGRTPQRPSGARGMIGQAAIVTETVGGEGSPGHVRVAGENWPATSEGGQTVEVGAVVRIVGLIKSSLVVAPVEPPRVEVD